MSELYLKHRPKRFSEVIGQHEAVKMLNNMVKRNRVPHTILLSGPSGTGKTTLARILAKKLGCSKMDLSEVNIADFKGIDTPREIRSRMSLSPLGGKCKVWILDEFANLRKDAMDAFLKILEDGSPHAYFFLATTEPQRIIKTIRTRCTEIKTKLVDLPTMKKHIIEICNKEDSQISDDVCDKILDTAEGSVRKALVILNQVLQLDKEEDQLNAITNADTEKLGIELCRILIKPNVQWREVAKIIENLEDDPESLRRMIQGYFNSVLLKSGQPRAAQILNLFKDNYYSSGKSGLLLSCYSVCQLNRRK